MDAREKESHIRECLLGLREKLGVQVETMIARFRKIMSFDNVADVICPELARELTDDEIEMLSLRLPMKLETADKVERLRKLVADKMKEYAEKSLK